MVRWVMLGMTALAAWLAPEVSARPPRRDAAEIKASPEWAQLSTMVKGSRTSQWFVAVGDQILVDDRDEGAAELVSIQSITKTVVSLAIGKLVGDGRVASIDDPVSAYVPEFTGGGRESVTIRQVLVHRTGIAAGDNFGLDVEESPDAVEWAIKAPLDAKPGEKFQYNNGPMALAGAVVERASGMPLDRYVAQEIFGPLGITRFEWAKDPAGRAWAHASLAMSAGDLGKLGRLVADRGAWRGTRLIAESWFDIATPKQTTEQTGVWWNLSLGEDSEASIDGATIDRYAAAGLDGATVAKMRALPASAPAMEFLTQYRERFTPEEMMAVRDLRVSKSLPPFFAMLARPEAYMSTGGGGQYLIVAPESGLVAVRLIERARLDGDATTCSDFMSGAMRLVNPETLP